MLHSQPSSLSVPLNLLHNLTGTGADLETGYDSFTMLIHCFDILLSWYLQPHIHCIILRVQRFPVWSKTRVLPPCLSSPSLFASSTSCQACCLLSSHSSLSLMEKGRLVKVNIKESWMTFSSPKVFRRLWPLAWYPVERTLCSTFMCTVKQLN